MAKIVTYPDSSLNARCVECELGDKTLAKLVKEMTKMMYDNNGCGIAAPQVGDNRRLCIIDTDYDIEDASTRDPIVLINPEIFEVSGDEVEESEGCLSCPGVSVPIWRKPSVKVRFYDLEGEMWEMEGDGLLGRCIQHEIDHLDGITLFDSCTPSVRLRALEAYNRAKAEGCKPGDTSIVIEKEGERH